MTTTSLPHGKSPRKPVRFKTQKSVFRLYRGLKLYDEFRKTAVVYQAGDLTRLFHAKHELHTSLFDLQEWSRSHRKLYGRPAVIDDFLIENNAAIRAALLKIEEAVLKMWRPYYPNRQAMIDMFERAWTALDALWTLDLGDDSAYQIALEKRRAERAQDEIYEDRTEWLASILKRLLKIDDEDDDCTWGVIPPKAEAPAKPVAAAPVEPLDAGQLIAALDEAFAAGGVE